MCQRIWGNLGPFWIPPRSNYAWGNLGPFRAPPRVKNLLKSSVQLFLTVELKLSNFVRRILGVKEIGCLTSLWKLENQWGVSRTGSISQPWKMCIKLGKRGKGASKMSNYIHVMFGIVPVKLDVHIKHIFAKNNSIITLSQFWNNHRYPLHFTLLHNQNKTNEFHESDARLTFS